jgi:hypothetical protein
VHYVSPQPCTCTHGQRGIIIKVEQAECVVMADVWRAYNGLCHGLIYDLKRCYSPGIVAHTCYSSYSGGGDWEDHSLRPAQAKS